MPVKISNRTNPEKGEITDRDRNLMKLDFDRHVKLKRSNVGNKITKKIAWYINRDKMEALIEKMKHKGKKPELIEINFAVSLWDLFEICSDQNRYDIGDCISIVIETKDKDKKPIPVKDQYVLIPGFKSHDDCKDFVKDKDCCPSSKPKTSQQ